MYQIDSYQNLVEVEGGEQNESIESVASGSGGDSMEHSGEENRGATAENADEHTGTRERRAQDSAGHSASRPKKERHQRRKPSGQGGGDRNESRFNREDDLLQHGPERGRGASGDPFEDPADNALFRSHRRHGPDRRHKTSTDHRR